MQTLACFAFAASSLATTGSIVEQSISSAFPLQSHARKHAKGHMGAIP